MTSQFYRVATDEEKKDVCSEDYDLLIGPDGFQCFLGEREDRYWTRDARPVVELLNSQRTEIERLSAELDIAKQNYVHACESIENKDRMIKDRDVRISQLEAMVL